MTRHTSQHHAEPDAAPQNDELLERVLGGMAAPALIFRSGDYVVVCANPRAEETLGFERGTLPGTDLRSIVDYESGIRPIQERRHQVSQPRGEYEVVVSCPDGRTRRAWGSFEEITYQGERSFLNVFTNVTEMREAEQSSRQETRERDTLAEIGRIVTSSPDISQVFAQFSEAVKQLIPCEGTRIFTVRPGTSDITNGHVYGLASSYDGPHRHDAPSGTLREFLLRTRKGIVIPDLETPGRVADLRTLGHLLDAGARSLLGVPLILGDQTIGTMHLVSSRKGVFDERHIRLAEQVAVQISGAIANDERRRSAEAHASEQSILADIGRAIGSSPDIQQAFDAVAPLATKLIPAERMVINTVDFEQNILIERYVWGLMIPERHLGVPEDMTGTMTEKVARERQGMMLNAETEGGADLMARFPSLATAANLGITACMAVPLVSGDKTVGTLHFRSAEARYTRRHLDVAAQIAAQVAGVIALSESRAKEERHAREQEALADIGRIIGSSLNIQQVYERFARELMKWIPADRVVVSQVDEASGTFTEAYELGLELPDRELGASLPLEGSFTSKVIEARAPVRLQGDEAWNRAETECPQIFPMLKAGMRSFLSSPLISNGRVIGVLHLGSVGRETYTDAHASLSQRIANQIAGAVANSELYGELSRRRREDEVISRIGRTLAESPDVEAHFNEFVSDLQSLVPGDRVEIALMDERRGVTTRAFGGGHGEPTKETGEETVLRGSLTEYVTSHGAGMAISRSDGEFFELFPSVSYLRDASYESAAVAPLVAGLHPVGILGVMSFREAAYGRHEVELVERVAAQIAGPIATAQLHTRQVQLLEEKARTARLDSERRELQRINEVRSQFLSTVSHELKTPLTSILAFMNLLEKERHGRLTEDQRRYVSVMQRNGGRLQRLIQDLLDVSRIGSGRLELERTEFDFRQVVNDVAESFDPILRERQQDLSIEMPERPVWVKADRGRVYQIITNLVGNAAKYSPERASIHARVIVIADSLRMEVTDNGVGMTDQDKARAFDMFFRADNEVTRATSGTGLGLAISQHIAALHGGYMGVESEPGQGSTFWFTLPGLLVSPPVESQANS